MTNAFYIVIGIALVLLLQVAMFFLLPKTGAINPEEMGLYVIMLCIGGGIILLYDLYRADLTPMQIYKNVIVCSLLLAMVVTDLKKEIIPNVLIVAGIMIWGIFVLIDVFVAGTSFAKILQFSLLGALGCGGLLFLIAILVKNALGMGDVKMFFLLGLFYGLSDTFGILFFTAVVMAVVAIILLIARKVTGKSMMPMAPFAAVGFMIGIFAGI